MTSQSTNSTPNYTIGYHPALMDHFRRMAGRAASEALLKSRLAPGMKILDVGCGTGFLSVQLAQAVWPGAVYGIDIEQQEIDRAQSIASGFERCNVEFQVADALALPFEDDYFDLVYCSGLFLYMPDTTTALSEAKRVLRPGGAIYCRDVMAESSFIHPDLGSMRRAWEMFEDLLAADDGHPDVARDMKLHLLKAGFADIEVSASIEMYQTPEETEFFYGLTRGWFLSGPAESAKEYGAATDRLLRTIQSELEEWRNHPAALAGLAFGQSIGIKP